MKSKYLIIPIMVILFILMFSAKVNAETSSFTLAQDNIDVALNGKKYLSYSGGTGTVSWSSADTSIATVDSNGMISGLKIGETIITAKRGNETATCKARVVYSSVNIGANESKSVSKVNLILGEHDSENLIAIGRDSEYKETNGVAANWKSSDSSIVTVDSTSGKISAVKSGTATITVEAAGATATCEVTVYDAPAYTDFKDAKYETSLNSYKENLKISAVSAKDNSLQTSYYYMITSNSEKPELNLTKNGRIDMDAMKGKIDYLSVNANENYLYTRNLAQYSELNQDLYLWVIQEESLSAAYYDTNGNCILKSTKFVVENKKIERTSLPPLNLILQTFSIGYWGSSDSNDDTIKETLIRFNFPTAVENRNFTLKIGKITDNEILIKIKNNDYAGITDLLSYAKNNAAVYTKQLTTTSEAYFRSKEALFDGRNLLENKAYYFIYVEFDDENGKYYPIEGVTLGQAYLSTLSDSWNLWAYTSDKFQWENLSPTYTSSTGDSTTAPGFLPRTGKNVIIILSIVSAIFIIGTLFYKKYNNYKDI
mgnify:CR=1 FL=1